VEEYTYTVSAGKATVTGYTGAGTDLLIPDLLGGYPTTALGDTCFSGRFFITSAVVPDGVTSLGQRAFFDCIRLQSVIIPDSVTSAGTAVFAHCVSLVSVELGHGLTAITDYMFDQCYSLHNIVLPDTVGTIGLYAFSSCSVLDTVQIQEGVASIAGMAFFDCPALPSVWIPSTVLTIDGFAFSQDDALFAVFLSEGLKQIGDYAFASCPILSDIDLPNGLESIGASAFTSCTALTAIDIPDSVQSIGASAFQSCTSLADVHLGTGLTAIAQATFVGCTSLTNITLPDGVLSVGFSAFFNCNALQSIDLGSGLTSIGSNAFGRCFALNGVSIPEGVATIGSDAFNNCTSLCEVIIPDSVISLADQAFDGCTSLRSVSLGENLYGIGGRAFRDCGQLTSISFHGLVAPFSVGPQWLLNTNVSILGHAYRDSNFPTPGNYWHGLLMGGYLPVIPEAPQNLQLEQGDGLLTLTWAPPEYDGSSAILYYQVYRAESAGGEYTLLFSPQRSLYVDSNVSSGQTYWYQVSAVNAIGEGPRSTSASALVVTSPSAPRSLHAASGDSVINITWQVPLEDGGLGIDDYLLYRSLSAGGPYSRIASLEQTYYEDEDLVIGRTYYYLVSAENAMGEGAQAGPVHARAITLPSAPTWLHAEGGDAQVFLEWTEPYDGGSSIHSYAIYRSSMVGGPYGLVGSSASASFTDLGLVNGMTYWYRVSARNDLGLGPLTQAMAATPSTTPEAPGNLQASAGDAMVTLTWSAPAYEGGRSIDHYVVYQDGVLLTTHYSDFSAVISGLSNGREYTFTVAAHNEAGIGDLSSPAHATPFTVPDVPGDLQAEASDARVTLIWSAPAFDGGRSIDHYVVYQDGVLLTTRYFDLSAVISGLSNGHAYTFTVAAHNEAGLGDRSNPAEATPCTVPDAPSDLQAEASDARVTLTWSAPAFDGGRPIDYYLVYQDGVLLATHYSVPRAIISGLSNGREYTFTVTAHNEVGQSAPSTGASATPLTIPGMPRGLYAPAGDRSVMLQWDPPAFDGGRPIDYYLVYQDGVAIGHFAREAAISG
ncbi:MAG: leucine-rich repeat protein, partial [Methanomassiliicoccales archaeon]